MTLLTHCDPAYFTVWVPWQKSCHKIQFCFIQHNYFNWIIRFTIINVRFSQCWKAYSRMFQFWKKMSPFNIKMKKNFKSHTESKCLMDVCQSSNFRKKFQSHCLGYLNYEIHKTLMSSKTLIFLSIKITSFY